MAKINTTNYQPVTAWNGTQDLFVVEQPDGTKVATPEQKGGNNGESIRI